MASGEGSGGSGVGDCEGEEQDDSSSSLSVIDVTDALDQIKLDSTNKIVEDELSQFRQQWQRELTSQETEVDHKSINQSKSNQEAIEFLTEEEKAKKLFLLGVELEKSGKLYEAIQNYKRAIQILPDVESRLYDGTDLRDESTEDESETEEVCREEADDSDDDAIEGEDLLTRLQRILAKKGQFCEPEHPTRDGHLSWLPAELVGLVLRWVVGAELDAVALERVGAVCRGLHVAARDPALWRALCLRTWGIECGLPRAHGFPSWRQMYLDRSRLNLHGCYISKTTYLRHGENSFQDQFYRPWYLIDYYRYLRFFPEGLVLMLTTPDEPSACVGYLKHRAVKNNLGIMSGHYRLVGDKVVILIKKSSNEKKPSQSTNTRFRARRKETHELQEQTFHMEFQLRSCRSRRNWQLWWRRYAVSTRRDQTTSFELAPAKFPPLAFSRVRSYTADSRAPLVCA